MLEMNTFRLWMLILGFMTSALLITGIFITPVIEMKTPQERTYYNKVMPTALDPSVDKLTVYQASAFYLKGTVRGNTKHY